MSELKDLLKDKEDGDKNLTTAADIKKASLSIIKDKTPK